METSSQLRALKAVSAALSMLAALVLACSSSTRADYRPTFHRDVEPVLQERCQKCHQPGGLAPFSLLTFADARRMSAAMKEETQQRRMPPWGAHDTAECTPRLGWSHDQRLTAAELGTIATWDATGAPEGDPGDAPPPTQRAPLELPNPTVTLTPQTPFVANGREDQFRCFVLPAKGLEQGSYVTGIHVVPGNRRIVHHAVVFTDPGGKASQRAGPDGSYECSGTPMTGEGAGSTLGFDSIMLDVWTPGVEPIDLPPRTAMPIVQGAKLVMQIHYSPRGGVNDPDLTTVQLRTTSEKPEYLLFTAALGNYKVTFENEGLLPGPGDPPGRAEFKIPAQAKAHVENMLGTLPARLAQQGAPIWIYGVMAHAHLAGIEVKVDLEKKEGTQCLLQDKWDFHWQRMYTYASPIDALPTLDPGDKIRLRCTYDNTMQNRRLAAEYAARGLQPMDIELGEESLDEMCLAITQLIVKHPGDDACATNATRVACEACCYVNATSVVRCLTNSACASKP